MPTKEDKVTIPKDVADAIEVLRINDFTNMFIVHNYLNAEIPLSDDQRNAMNKIKNIIFDDLLQALVNGYEVERSPEEKVNKLAEEIINKTKTFNCKNCTSFELEDLLVDIQDEAYEIKRVLEGG